MNEQNQTSEVLVIERALPTLKNLPQILAAAQVSSSGACRAMDALVLRCEHAGNMTAELDDECKNLILKVGKTTEKLEEARKPATQMMTEIASLLIAEENKMKGPLERLKDFRNRRAKWVIDENKRIEREAAEKAAKEKEKANLATYFTKEISRCLNAKLHTRQTELTAAFESLTLAGFDERAAKLRNLVNTFPTAKMEEILNYSVPITWPTLNMDEIRQINDTTRAGYGMQSWMLFYTQELDKLRDSLIDRLPSKRTQLQEKQEAEDRAERLRLEKEENDRRQRELEERQRNERDEQRRQQLQKEKEENDRRQKELQEKQDQERRDKEERDRQEQQRQEEQRQQLEKERIEREKQASEQADVAHAGMVAGSLFDGMNTAAQKEQEGEVRKGWQITVTHMAGWAEIFQFWYLAKAAATPLDKFGDVKLDKMKAYAESVAGTEKIQSKYLVYEETVTAVNRKDRSKKPVV